MQSLLAVSVLSCLLFGCCHGQCEVLNQSNLTKIDLCQQVYTRFEQALISDEANLYTLRETFFSTEHHSPSLIIFRYRIQANDLQNETNEIPVPWSSSSLFKFVNPFLIMASIPTTMFVAFFMINIQILPHQITLSLGIDASDTIIPLDYKEKLEVLLIMTAKIKAYAVAQTKLTQWDGSNNGYIIPFDKAGRESIVFLVVPTILLSIFILMLLAFMAQMKRNRLTRTRESKQYMLSVLYSTGIIAFFFNVLEICLAIDQSKLYAKAEVDIFKVLVVIKGLYLSASFIVAICFAGFGWKKAQVFPVNYCCTRLWCCFSRCSNLRHKLIHSFTLFNVSYFSFSLLTSICPILLLFFVYPSEVITLLVVFGTFLFCMVTFLASFLSYNTTKKQVKGSSRPNLPTHIEKVARQTVYIIPLLVFVFLMYFYLKILANTDYTGSNKLIQTGVSLLPSLILGILGYFSRTWFEFFHKEICKDEDPTSDKETAVELQRPQEKQLVTDSDIEGSELENSIIDNGNESTELLSKQKSRDELEDESRV